MLYTIIFLGAVLETYIVCAQVNQTGYKTRPNALLDQITCTLLELSLQLIPLAHIHYHSRLEPYSAHLSTVRTFW